MTPWLPQQARSNSPHVSWPSYLRSDRLCCALVCGIASVCYIASLQGDHVLGSSNLPAHEFVAPEPEWTQLVFPRLGVPTLAPTSPTGIATGLASLLPENVPRFALIAAAAQTLALALFYVFTRLLRVPPAIASIATLTLGLHSIVFAAATAWTPYLWLPALLLTVFIARHFWLGSRHALWAVVLIAAAVATVAESLHAIVLLIPVMIDVVAGQWRTRRSSIWHALAIGLGAVLVGLSFQVLGAAIEWREASIAGPGRVPSWQDALVAVTSRWGRVVQTYTTLTAAQVWKRGLNHLAEVGLLASTLAAAGIVSLVRGSRRDVLLLALSLVLGIVLYVWPAAPVSTVAPARVVSIVVAFALAASGLAYTVQHFRAPAWVAAFVGVVFIVNGQAARTLESRMPWLAARRDVPTTIVPAVNPGWIVAGNVESDRYLQYAIDRQRVGTSVVRIPYSSASIRSAHRIGWPVLLRHDDRVKVAALGWLVAPHPSDDGNVRSFYEIVADMACVEVRGDGWVDVTRPGHAGAVGIEASRPSGYAIDIEPAAPSEILTEDLATGATLDFRVNGTRVSIPIEQPRRSLPLVQFNPVPSRLHVRLVSEDPQQSVRICGAPLSGEAVWWRAGENVAEVDLASLSIFWSTWQSGWHGPERIDTGGGIRRWSATVTAPAFIQLPGPPANLEVEIDAAPAVPPTRSPTLTLEINGHRLAPQAMTAGIARYTFAVDRQHVREGLNVFRFHVPEVVSPKSLGISGDDRNLGFALTGFRLRRMD